MYKKDALIEKKLNSEKTPNYFHVEASQEREWSEGEYEFNYSLAHVLSGLINKEWNASLFTSGKIKFYSGENPSVCYQGHTEWFEIIEDGLNNDLAEFSIQTNPNIFYDMSEFHIFFETNLMEGKYNVLMVGIFENTKVAHENYKIAMDRVSDFIIKAAYED